VLHLIHTNYISSTLTTTHPLKLNLIYIKGYISLTSGYCKSNPC
jgi:hypothetical protein